MLHQKRVLTTLYYAFRRRVRLALGIPARPKPPPVLAQPIDYILGRHGWIVENLIKHAPPGLDLRGRDVCEIGAGDCLATSAFFLAKGARHVDIIEVQPPVVDSKQAQVLKLLKAAGHPIDLTVIESAGEGVRLDSRRISYHNCFMENLQKEACYDFVFSSSVLEHVEDLTGFYAACWKRMNSGGHMLHLIDLGGHELFEDPLPPLDFQTYPDWLYDVMFPKYHRATRRFLSEHLDAVKSAGFTIEQITGHRKAENGYLDEVWPKLRPAARQRPKDEIRVIEFAVLARKS